MYDKETKTFSFPYDQKRIDALKYMVKAEADTHNWIVSTRNTYKDKHIEKIDRKYRYYFRETNIIKYWDSIIDSARKTMATDSYIILCNSELSPKGD